ncbi:MAG: hypothetical protein K2N92_00075, partial [Malacoplasma sp.]|nr:hypothetical protein [Malacoplasma sp.]
GLATLNSSSNSVHLISKSLNVNESTTDSSINLEDALPVADTSIKSFGDYIVSYEDNNVSPVNVIIPSLTTGTSQTGVKAGGATVGMTANKQTITVTTYAGLLLWSHKLTENPLLKSYYSSVLSQTNISTYKVINFAYLESKNILFVLFGNESTANSVTTLSNLVVFGLDINSGAIVVPKDAKLAESQVIAKARNNSEFIFFNSSDQLIVTSGSTNANIQVSTKIMSFDDNSGFANVKGNDDETNNFGTVAGVVNSTNDYLLGFLPSGVKGINFSVWLYDFAITSTNYAKPQLSYSTSNDTTGAPETSINKSGNTGSVTTTSYNYYVFPVNDEFVNLTPSNNSNYKYSVANMMGNNTYRGYLNSQNSFPDFNSIYKRFFITSSKLTDNTITESIGVLLDSYDKMFASFSTVPVTLNVTNTTFTYGLSNTSTNTSNNKIYFNVANNQLTGPTSGSLNYDETKKTGLQNDVVVNNWGFNSVGYDKESDFVYFSLSGEEHDYSSTGKGDANGKYLTNTRYIDLKSATSDATRVSSDDYIEENPYTLSDVNFDTYSSDNIYLTKQVIDGDNGQWLFTTPTNFNDDTKNFEPTTNSKIDFYSLENLAKDIQDKSTALKNMMPSSIQTSSLDDFLKENQWSDFVKFKKVQGDDKTGEINLETEITYANNFGDSETTTASNNGSVYYDSYIRVTGFLASKDFSLTFKQDTDSAVTEIKSKYSAEKIVQSITGKAFVINHLFENLIVNGEKFIPSEENVTLKNGNSTNSLVVEVKVPIKTSLTDEKGILPVGFPENDAVLTFTYDGFTGTETPPIEQYPDSTNKPSNQNPVNGLSAGEIAGIVIGCLALAAIIIAVVVLIRIRTKAKVRV